MDPVPFEVVDVTAWSVDREEPVGTGEGVWLADPATDVKWIYKPATVKNGIVYGDDWAEKAAADVAALLTVPAARVQLAVRGGRRGVISRSLRPDSHDLVEGNLLLAAVGAPGYVMGRPAGRPGHTPANIRRALHGMLPPPGAAVPAVFDAYDVFCGYLVLDALIANADRHDQNWAVLRSRTVGGPDLLCGAYDQGNSLGYNVLGEVRRRRLATLDGGVPAWVVKGRARRFEYTPGSTPPTLVELADAALELAGQRVRSHWLERVAALDPEDTAEVLARIPEMSDEARTFASSVLDVNRKRLLDGCR